MALPYRDVSWLLSFWQYWVCWALLHVTRSQIFCWEQSSWMGYNPPPPQKQFLFVRQNCACDNMPVEVYYITVPTTENRLPSVVIMLCRDRWQRCFQWAQHEVKRSNHDVVPLTLKWHCVSAVLPLKKRNYSLFSPPQQERMVCCFRKLLACMGPLCCTDSMKGPFV